MQPVRLILYAILAAMAARAQDTGRLSGAVMDPTGASVPAAKVELYLAGGGSAVFVAATTTDGLFHFVSVRPDFYNLVIEAAGFRKYTALRVKIDPGRETSLPPIRLELGPVTESVEVTVGVPGVQLTNAEVSTTLANNQINLLPVGDRNVLQLILTQPGVTSGRTPTTINGLRTGYANVTLDGVNVQDNFLRENSLDFLPNLLTNDQVAEMTILTSNGNATVGGGVAQVSFITPSGTNELHGSTFWFNRNNALSANSWFNNKDGIRRPFLNLNHAGGRLGGPLVKNKLLFYATYEAYRLREQTTANRVILTSTARQGIYTYRNFQGATLQSDVLQLGRVPIDPFIRQMLDRTPGPERINNFRAGDSTESLQRNTGGYSFLIRDNRTRDNLTGKLDWIRSPKQTIFGSYAWNRDVVDRPDQSNDYSDIPKVFNDDDKHFLSAGWRWNPAARLTIEVRGGFNLAPATFHTVEQFPPFLLRGLAFSNPVNLTQAQGRDTDTYAFQSNNGYAVGRHSFQFGLHSQVVRVNAFDDFGILPTYIIGTGLRNPSLSTAQLPGIGASDLSAANNLFATLAGYVVEYSQFFNVTSRTSGFIPGATNRRHYSLDNYALYVQDAWKLARGLTLNLGLRYDYYTRVNERDALALMPVIQFNSGIQTLLSNGTLDFAGTSVGRPFYDRDKNNFAPNVSVAWDPFGDGKTSFRAGYTLGYVNDQYIATNFAHADANNGLSSEAFATSLAGRISVNLPRIPTPRFRVPRTFADVQLEDPVPVFTLPDPRLRTGYVQQWTAGVQREFKGTVFELRYVGNHATKALRSFDHNQVQVRENGFLDDFRRAQNNGILALARSGIFDPRFNPAIAGSQPLTVFPRLDGGGLLTNSTVTNIIRRGEVGQLALIYQANELNGPINFYRNPFAIGGAILITNYANSTYNAMQFDVRRPFRGGLMFQANYTFSKVLSDATGVSQINFEPFLDLGNPGLERSRAPFDINHVIKANGIYELPIGPGHRLNHRWLGRVLGGWTVSALANKQSGTPFSILSGRGTLNVTGRSFANTAVTALKGSDLDRVIGLRMTGNGPYFFAAAVTGADGRAVGQDGRPPFDGQIFLHPEAGNLGTLQRRMFSGPWIFDFDFGVRKTTRITERQSVALQMFAYNVLNHPTFFVGDQAIDSTAFGRIQTTFTVRRQIQFGLIYQF